MSPKFLLTFAVLAVAICGASCAVVMAEESDAASTYSTGVYSGSGSATVTNVTTGTSGSSVTASSGDTIRFSASAASGYAFTRWINAESGVPVSTSNPYTRTAVSSGSFTIQAEFESSSTTYTWTFSPSPSRGGSVSISSLTIPAGTSYSQNGNVLTVGSTTVTATPASGWAFSIWGVGSSGTVTSDRDVPARFVEIPPTYTMSVGVNTGSGTVQIRNNTTGYSSSSSVSATAGDSLTYTATPSSGWAFTRWINGDSTHEISTANPYSRTAPSYSYDVQAVFEQVIPVTLTFTANPTGSGTLSTSSLTVNSGTSYTTSGNTLTIGGTTVTATPAEGYMFRSWSVPSSGTVYTDREIVANFAEMFEITVDVTGSGTATVSNETTGTSGTSVFATSGDVIVFTATAASGNAFMYWKNAATDHEVSSSNPYRTTAAMDYDMIAVFAASVPVTLTFGVNPENAGVVSETSLIVDSGTPFSTEGDTLTIGQTIITASALDGFEFRSWSLPESGTITTDREITANFRTASPTIIGTHWTNDNYNGRIDIIFNFEGNGTQEITGDLFTGSSSAGVANWTPTGYSVKTFVEKSGTQTRVGAQILQGTTVIKTNATGGSWPNVGSWDALQVSIDPENAQVVFTPVSVLNSFTDYKLYSTQARTMLSWGEVLESSAIRTLQHEASGDAPRFSVVGTRVFLNTYNAVLFDPRINVREKFPQYDSVRLNFYSFALYGDSMTVNGYTYPVTGDKITITYVDSDGTHYAVGAVPGGEQRTRDFTLSNIYVSWDALTGHCTLTFVNDRWTLDMGEYTHQVVSFAGMWYFYTMLYDSHVTQDKSLGDWKTLPETNQSQMVLIYLGILAVAGTAGLIHIRHGGHATLDLIVIGCAGLVGYILLG